MLLTKKSFHDGSNDELRLWDDDQKAWLYFKTTPLKRGDDWIAICEPKNSKQGYLEFFERDFRQKCDE